VALVALGPVRAQAGDLEAAIELAGQWYEATRRMLRSDAPRAQSLLATLHLERGDAGRARQLALEALEDAERHGFRAGLGPAHVALARIDLSEGRFDDATARLDQAAASFEASGALVALPEVWELRAAVAAQRADGAARTTALDEAMRLYREMGAPAQAERIAHGAAA